ncbi:MAG: pseudouridine synthase [Acutalibacteraceae bacterium]
MEKIRIQKALSECGIASRRKAEELIKQNLVSVNGKTAKIGDKVDLSRDKISVDGKLVACEVKKYYIMLHKPRGFVSTMSDELSRKCVADLVRDVPAKIYPVGRLDKDSEGLLLMTNDGDFSNAILHPSRHVEKKYRVTVKPKANEKQLVKLSSGMEIDGYKTEPARITVLKDVEDRTVLEVIIKEGRNRQIRKMCEQVGLNVARLKRISIGQLKLGMLQPRQWRDLSIQEVKMFIK